jgi:hypothetical protein
MIEPISAQNQWYIDFIDEIDPIISCCFDLN